MQSISKNTLIDMLRFVMERTELAISRTEDITDYHVFLRSPTGMDLFDATCMRLQTIGETMKKVDAFTKSNLLVNYPEVFWKGVFGLRNIISHEYLSVNPAEIFVVVKNDLPLLLSVLRQIITDIEEGKYQTLFPPF